MARTAVCRSCYAATVRLSGSACRLSNGAAKPGVGRPRKTARDGSTGQFGGWGPGETHVGHRHIHMPLYTYILSAHGNKRHDGPAAPSLRPTLHRQSGLKLDRVSRDACPGGDPRTGLHTGVSAIHPAVGGRLILSDRTFRTPRPTERAETAGFRATARHRSSRASVRQYEAYRRCQTRGVLRDRPVVRYMEHVRRCRLTESSDDGVTPERGSHDR